MRTYILVRKEATLLVEISGPCVEADVMFADGLEMIDETLFKTLHPIYYRAHVMENLVQAVATWIESFYDESKQIEVTENAIFTEEYICQPTPSEIHLMFRVTCLPSEAAALVLHLKLYVPEDIPITITMLPASDSSQYLN